ncbi:MAG TPA: hypothetical protein VEN81_03805 [Planctomycetota bacterium]|nr:hypothetical protein [Planctomycetota bacterium]
MKTFLMIGAAILIAGAATVAVAADHKGQKKHVAAATAPVKNASEVATLRASAHKSAAPARRHGKRHHRAAHHGVRHGHSKHHAKK